MNSDGESGPRIQAKSEKLPRDASTFFDLAQPVFLIENAKASAFMRRSKAW